jgi:3'-5' exoribonuclease
MEKTWVSDLQEGLPVDSTFLVTEKELRPFRDKPENYLALRLADKTGSIVAKCWEGAEEAAAKIKIGDVVRIIGTVNFYKDNIQIIFTPDHLEAAEGFSMADYVAESEFDTEVLVKELTKIASGFKNEYLKSLVLSFFADMTFTEEFKKKPASKFHHHNYVGGLAEHTFAVTFICTHLAKLYTKMDRELLLAAAIIHDCGKTRTYIHETTIEITAQGSLIDHKVLGLKMVEEKMSGIKGFPEELAMKLYHMILSHHGEKGDVKPQFPEAEALYMADYLDSRVQEMIQIIEAEKRKDDRGIWSEYTKAFGRYLYLGEKE